MADTVLLAGATGYMGSRVARELLEHGYRLLCPVRSLGSPSVERLRELPAQDDALLCIETDLADLAALQSALSGHKANAVVSCIASRQGGLRDSEVVEYTANHNLLTWAQAANVGHFVLLSAICVQKPRLAFQRHKLRFERELMDSGLRSAIVRPTAFFKSLSGQLARVQRGQPFLVFGDGQRTRCKPIAEADLAEFLRLVLEDPSRAGVLPIGGPGPALTPRDQVAILEKLLERPVATRSVSPVLLSSIARLLDLPGRFSTAMADKAEFARIGHYYATESMLVWDAQNQRYSDEATPEFGSITLEDSYRAQLRGEEDQHAGSHAVFK